MHPGLAGPMPLPRARGWSACFALPLEAPAGDGNGSAVARFLTKGVWVFETQKLSNLKGLGFRGLGMQGLA